MKFKKNKGHIMIDILFSIALIGIIASFILPNLSSLMLNNKKAQERDEFVSFVQSNLEEIIGENYHNGGLNPITKQSDKYEINVENEKIGNLNKVTINGKSKNNEKELQYEIYLWDEGIFTD
jgi:type II secretory pathway pseudopilin PulG